MVRVGALTLAAAGALLARGALADTHVALSPGGGLPALDVSVDLTARVVLANGSRLALPLDAAQVPEPGEVVVEAVPIGLDRRVVHVRVPVKGGAPGSAWEALLAPGRPHPVFAGMTGFSAGDPGERRGKAIQLDSQGATSYVLVGDVEEDLGICGQTATLLDPLALYPASLELRAASVQRLSPEQQAAAAKVVAAPTPAGAAPALAKLLVARGSSVSGSRGSELTDGDPQTVWSERRPGVGQGEFVVMAAPAEVPIVGVRLTVAPPGASPTSGASPATFFLVTDQQTFAVTLEEDAWLEPGARYDVVFPRPIQVSCVALVLDSAHTRNQAHPQVGLAELEALSDFDARRATLDDVARELSGARGAAAAQVLERAGEGALAAVAKAFDTLDARGRALAMDIAAAHDPCEKAAPLLARGLCATGAEAGRKAREKFERCPGAATVLAQSLREQVGLRVCLAPALAAISPAAALQPIADALGTTEEADSETRGALREALAEALRTASASAVVGLLTDASRGLPARLEILRAAAGRLAEARAESEALLGEVLQGTPSLRTRYLVLGPLEELARAGDGAAAQRVRQALAGDPEWPVRRRAAEAIAGLPDAMGPLLQAARDPAPRVREAALRALPASAPPEVVQAVGLIAAGDAWPFVRAQAIGVLARAVSTTDVDAALGAALRDVSAAVRAGALLGLAGHGASAWRKAIRERLEDGNEDVDVRSAAARALGNLCDRDSTDLLTDLANGLGVPGAEVEEQELAFASLEALAALHPADLRGRLASLLVAAAPPQIRAAAQQAIAAQGTCR